MRPPAVLPIFCVFLFLISVALGQNSDTIDESEKCVQECLLKHPQLLKRFNRDQLLSACKRHQSWRKAASNSKSRVTDFLAPAHLAYLGQLWNCRGSDCLQNVGTDGIRRGIHVSKVDNRAVRKEYRVLTDEERRRYHDAINKLKSGKVNGISKYNLLAIYHTPALCPGAHGGPAFLPFHREYIKQYEIALRQIDPRIGLPYWDSTLDEGLPNPKDSILWTADFLGNANGPVTIGPFAGWIAVQELHEGQPGERRLAREVGMSPNGGLYKVSDADFFLNYTSYKGLVGTPTIEVTHSLIHFYIGGYMADLAKAANDPAFYMFHCFIDYLWEQFRHRQNRLEREVDYPDVQIDSFHHPNATMTPFDIRNIDGLSESYTRELCRYEPRPVCGKNGHCFPPSPYLFCHAAINRCLSKIQLHGNCSGLENQNACYGGICKKGFCVKKPETEPASFAEQPAVSDDPIAIIERLLLPDPNEKDASPTQSQVTSDSLLDPKSIMEQILSNLNEDDGTTQVQHNSPLSEPSENTVVAISIPAAFITITVLQGSNGLYTRHATDAVVSVQGSGSPLQYVHIIDAMVLAETSAPSYIGACILKIYDPDQADRPVRFSVTATVSEKLCKIQCWNKNRKRYENCVNRNHFRVRADGRGDPIPYFPTPEEALQSRWTGRGYKRSRIPDYIAFHCPL